MRLSLRFILPLILVLAGIAYGIAPLVDQLTLRWFIRDLNSRSTLIANTIQEPLLEQLAAGKRGKIEEFFNRITQDERLFALGYCASPKDEILASRSLPAEIRCGDLDRWQDPQGHLLESAHGPLHVSVRSMASEATPGGQLVLVHDMSFITRRTEETKRYVFYFFMALAAVVSLITVVIAQLSWRGWMAGMSSLLRGEGLLRKPSGGALAPRPEFKPIARDLQRLIQDLETESRARDESQITWTPEALRTILHSELSGEDVIVVSNREPYIHQRHGERIEVSRPASGLVTALEPIMRACSGTWIAHGSGSADRAVVDKNDRIQVPPERPTYQLRRVWLSPEEEAGYYYGFANEGMWPLCHIAHVRPDLSIQRLGAIRGRQPEVCRSRGERSQNQSSHRPGPGLSLRPATENDPRSASGRHHHHLLAHTLAQSRVLCHLSLAGRNIGGHVGQQHYGLSHPVPLQQLCRHGGPHSSRRGWIGNPSPSPTEASSPPCGATRFPSPGLRKPRCCRSPFRTVAGASVN